MRASPVANMAPPPSPCSARDQIRNCELWATPHISDASVNTIRPAANTRLRPNRSAIDPQVRITLASDSA